MKLILTTIVAILTTVIVLGQSTKDTFNLTSPLYLDSLGNIFITRQVYDHVPTLKDSLDFQEGTKMIMNLYFRDHSMGTPNKVTRKRNMYPVVVEAIRGTKKGATIIRPYSKHKLPWYRYPFANVKIGDTIWVTDGMRIEPRF